ncbi:hypothetical protein, partial [Enterococcus faecalis]
KPTGRLIKPELSLDDITEKVLLMGWVKAAKELEVSESTLRRRYTKLTGLSPKVLTEQRKSK